MIKPLVIFFALVSVTVLASKLLPESKKQEVLSSQIDITPLPTAIFIDTYETPLSTPRIIQEVRTNVYKKNPALVDCVGPDGKHLQLTQEDCDKFNSAWDKTSPVTQTRSSNPSNTDYSILNIDCSSTQSEYSYNFGKIPYDQCYRKVDEFFAQRMQTISNNSDARLQKTLEEMEAITSAKYAPVKITPIDGKIYMESTPTKSVPHGFSNY